MRKNKIIIIALVLIMILAASVTAFAFTARTSTETFAGFTGRIPIGILGGLTKKGNEDLAQIRYESGKTYGQIAYEEGEDVWEEFRDEILQTKKAILKERVTEGNLTQEEADEILKNIDDMQEYCLENGGGFGMMRNRSSNGNSFGMGNRSGNGNGFGNGKGMGLGGGRCGRGSFWELAQRIPLFLFFN